MNEWAVGIRTGNCVLQETLERELQPIRERSQILNFLMLRLQCLLPQPGYGPDGPCSNCDTDLQG
jgi:hypothetical protein